VPRATASVSRPAVAVVLAVEFQREGGRCQSKGSPTEEGYDPHFTRSCNSGWVELGLSLHRWGGGGVGGSWTNLPILTAPVSD